MKLVDTLDEQALLERLIEDTKPAVPPECRHLHYLLATPFRYGSYPRGSRFRRAGMTPGVFYGSEGAVTAIAETTFHRLLFFAESPATPWPTNAAEFTAFSLRYASAHGIDLTAPPLSKDRAWLDPTDYEACQKLADAARAAGVTAIRYQSARDPESGVNLAILSCTAFMQDEPDERQTWRIQFGRSGTRAVCEFPDARLEFAREAFIADPRIAALNWDR